MQPNTASESLIADIRVAAFRYASGATIALPDIAIEAGEIVIVSGRSGSGKSTLLHLTTGVLALRREQGSLGVAGVDLADVSQKERDALRPCIVGWMPQRVHLLHPLSVLENVLVPISMAMRTTRNTMVDARVRAHTLLDAAGIATIADKMPNAISVGQASRACAVRALLAKPKLLCADEPSAALDRENSTALAKLIASYVREGGTALIASHDFAFVERLKHESESVREIVLKSQ